MPRLARMMGLGGAVVLGTGLFLAAPAHAATTPDATLTIPALGGITCQNGQHQIIFNLDLASGVDADVTISAVTLTVNGAAVAAPTFAPNPIPANATKSNASATVTGSQINSIAASVDIQASGGEVKHITLAGTPTAAACENGGGTTSSTTSTTVGGSTTSTTTGSTSTTTGGSTTTTVGGTTTSTSTTLGPNDTTGTLTVTPSTVAPGGTVTVAGTGFAANVDVTLTLFSDPIALGTLRSNANGAISGSISMPTSAPAGAHKIEAKGANAAGNGINLLKGDVTVRAASTTIPRTGSSDWLLPVGLAVVSFGILALAWRERRLTA